MICPYCNKEAKWCENKEKYGRNYGKSYMCYYCKDCDAYVGCHNNTREPLGTMANKELQQWRIKVHNKIDPIWRSGRMLRHEVYNHITQVLKLDKKYHTGEADIELCKKVLEINFKKG